MISKSLGSQPRKAAKVLLSVCDWLKMACPLRRQIHHVSEIRSWAILFFKKVLQNIAGPSNPICVTVQKYPTISRERSVASGKIYQRVISALVLNLRPKGDLPFTLLPSQHRSSGVRDRLCVPRGLPLDLPPTNHPVLGLKRMDGINLPLIRLVQSIF